MSRHAGDLGTPSRQVFVDLTGWRLLQVTGGHAIDWLNDLLTADVTRIGRGGAARSLLLTPTGGIRADVTVARSRDAVLLVQDPAQPEGIDRLLAPYVLSSDVELHDRSGERCLFALPGAQEPPRWLERGIVDHWAPSCLGPGVDLFAPAAEREAIAHMLVDDPSNGAEGAPTDWMDRAIQAWRVRQGIPRFGVDALPGDLPQEAGLEGAVAFDKGCYLGQEAVAKVRNLGHPRRLLVRLRASSRVAPGDPVIAGGEEVGMVTSATPAGDDDGDATLTLARIRWGLGTQPLVTAAGVSLVPVEGA